MSAPHPVIQDIEKEYRRDKKLPDFRPGDTIKVWVKIREGDKTRLQAFEGVCIKRTRGGARASFTVRKISYGVGVERIFPFYSPNVEKVEVRARGRVRRSKLYYLRELRGKAARIRERVYDRAKAKAQAEAEARAEAAAEQAAAEAQAVAEAQAAGDAADSE
ncbi:MAG: 50S ribosomal protein L19 [Deltaproteobacteria bacterium]|nr:MAG: 50S ribosomal protein L19 [Deltaproteobacteria bacterium]